MLSRQNLSNQNFVGIDLFERAKYTSTRETQRTREARNFQRSPRVVCPRSLAYPARSFVSRRNQELIAAYIFIFSFHSLMYLRCCKTSKKKVIIHEFKLKQNICNISDHLHLTVQKVKIISTFCHLKSLFSGSMTQDIRQSFGELNIMVRFLKTEVVIIYEYF